MAVHAAPHSDSEQLSEQLSEPKCAVHVYDVTRLSAQGQRHSCGFSWGLLKVLAIGTCCL